MVYSEDNDQNHLRLFSKRQRIKEEILNFLFPIRIYHSASAKIRLLILIGITIAMKIVLGMFSIRIYDTLRFSFSWIPISILGWHIGPIFSFFVGAFTDTLGWLMGGSVWFWMYAIQQPLEMMINSIFGYIFQKRRHKKSLIADYIFVQIIILLFTVSTMYFALATSRMVNGVVATSLKASIVVAMCIFFIVIEVFLNYKIFKRKKDIDNLHLFIYVTAVSAVGSYVFSFILGTTASIEYYVYITHGSLPGNYGKYGFLFYLFPHVIKETFRLPLIILFTYAIQKTICIPEFDRLKSNAKIYW